MTGARVWCVAGMALVFVPAPRVRACGCGRPVCIQHCPAEALATPENRQEAMAQLDQLLANEPHLTPEQRAAVAPLLGAAKSVKAAVGDATLGGRRQEAELAKAMQTRIPVSSALDEAAVIGFLGRQAKNRALDETARETNDQVWNSLVGTRLGSKTVTVTGFSGDGHPIIERTIPPSPAAGAQPEHGIRNGGSIRVPAEASEARPQDSPGRREMLPPRPTDPAAREKAEAAIARVKAQEHNIVVHHIKEPPSPQIAKEQRNAAEGFIMRQVERFRAVIHGGD